MASPTWCACQERPSIREWKLQGNEELSKDDFKESIDLKPFQILDLDAVRRNVKKIQEKYVEKGFFLAEVTYKIAPVQGANQADVVFVINEHAKVMVKQVNLIGADKVSADDLKALMITREGSYFGVPHRRGHLPRGGLPARPGDHRGRLLRPRLPQREGGEAHRGALPRQAADLHHGEDHRG